MTKVIMIVVLVVISGCQYTGRLDWVDSESKVTTVRERSPYQMRIDNRSPKNRG